METIICYKTKDGKIFQKEEEAIKHEAAYSFKKELYDLGSIYDHDIINRIFDDRKHIEKIITKYKKDIGEELNGK